MIKSHNSIREDKQRTNSGSVMQRFFFSSHSSMYSLESLLLDTKKRQLDLGKMWQEGKRVIWAPEGLCHPISAINSMVATFTQLIKTSVGLMKKIKR